MAYEMVMPYHLHMPSYFLETFTEYPYAIRILYIDLPPATVGSKMEFRARRRNFACYSRFGSNSDSDRYSQ